MSNPKTIVEKTTRKKPSSSNRKEDHTQSNDALQWATAIGTLGALTTNYSIVLRHDLSDTFGKENYSQLNLYSDENKSSHSPRIQPKDYKS